MEVTNAPKTLISEDAVKIFIRDIHSLERDENNPNYYFFRGWKIRKVDVMGVVTEVRELPDARLYRVDDGTGEILCKHRHHTPKILGELKELEQLQDLVAEMNYHALSEVGEAMECIIEESFHKHNQFMSSLDQGESVHLQGFIADYHGARQLSSYKLYKVIRFEDEIDRIYELSHMYSTVYDKM